MENAKKQDILSMNDDELKTFVLSLGEPGYRAKQLREWMTRGAPSFDDMKNLPAALREKLKERAEYRLPKVAARFDSKLDETVKFVLELIDGEYIECVVMEYHHGTTLCVSSQVGCRMGCAFCASTIDGKVRDLYPSELLGQVIVAARETKRRIDGIVLMGIGEPLDNYDNVIRFLHLVHDEGGPGIGMRHISLSTCGLVGGIDRLADEALPVTLSISLHAPTDELRSAIMPVNRRYGVDELLGATLRYFEKTGRRISFEYTLISGKNDNIETAKQLCALFSRTVGKKMPLHVNLIPVNPVKERGFVPGSTKEIRAFAAYLEQHGITATVRRTLGADINASCGQLRRRVAEQNKDTDVEKEVGE